MEPLRVPECRLAAEAANDDEALKKRREEIRRRLLAGEKVVVNKQGEVKEPGQDDGKSIQVPPGKLA